MRQYQYKCTQCGRVVWSGEFLRDKDVTTRCGCQAEKEKPTTTWTQRAMIVWVNTMMWQSKKVTDLERWLIARAHKQQPKLWTSVYRAVKGWTAQVVHYKDGPLECGYFGYPDSMKDKAIAEAKAWAKDIGTIYLD